MNQIIAGVSVEFKNCRVTIVKPNSSGPNHVIELANEQAVTLARAILAKLDRSK